MRWWGCAVSVLLLWCCEGFLHSPVTQFRSFRKVAMSQMSHSTTSREFADIHQSLPERAGGTLVVSGLGHTEADEAALQQIHSQTIWSRILLLSADPFLSRKRLLSRTARYSGLSDVLDVSAFPTVDEDCDEFAAALTRQLNGAQAWLAFHVPQRSITRWAELACNLSIPRVIFTSTLSTEQISRQQLDLPAFALARDQFLAKGLHFTGVRHGDIVSQLPIELFVHQNRSLPADSDAYVIGNRSSHSELPFVTQNTLMRTVCALLPLTVSEDYNCVISATANPLAEEYLRLLRESGLSTAEEVVKVLAGGIYRAQELVDQLHATRRSPGQGESEDAEDWDALSDKAAECNDGSKVTDPFASEVDQLLNDTDTDNEDSIACTASVIDEIRSSLEVQQGNISFLGLMERRLADESQWLNATHVQECIDHRLAMLTHRSKLEWEEQTLTSDVALPPSTTENMRELQLQAQREVRDIQKKKLRLIASLRAELEDMRNAHATYLRVTSLENTELQKLQHSALTWLRYLLLVCTRLLKAVNDHSVFAQLPLHQQISALREAVDGLHANSGLPLSQLVWDYNDAVKIVEALWRTDSYLHRLLTGPSNISWNDIVAADANQLHQLLTTRFQLWMTLPVFQRPAAIVDEATAAVNCNRTLSEDEMVTDPHNLSPEQWSSILNVYQRARRSIFNNPLIVHRN